MKLYKRLTSIIIISFIQTLLIFSVRSQDTTSHLPKTDSTKKFKSKDTVYVPPLISYSKYQYISLANPDTITRNRFLWYPSKDFINLFDNLPGYFLNYMDAGQIQRLSYDQLDNHYTTVLRHGRPINDLIDGSVDFNLLSRNEVSEIELSNGYANSLYPFNNVINIIPRQVFQNKPFSEISYWQDLNENINFDGSFHKDFFKLLNFNFGITKHSYDGKYANSSFDQWAGRFNFNYIGSKKFNAFLYSNYSKIQRGLNEGLDVTQLNTFTREDVFLSTDPVLKPNANETRERFDIDAGAIYTYGKNQNSFSKIQFFESNSVRRYQDSAFVDMAHWINYGVKLQTVLEFPFGKGFNFKSSSEIEYDKDLLFSDMSDYLKTHNQSGRQYLIENIALSYRNFSIEGFAKAYKHEYFNNKFYSDYGIKSQYDILKDSLMLAGVYGAYNVSHRIPTYREYHSDWGEPEKITSISSGIVFKYKLNSFDIGYYLNKLSNGFDYVSISQGGKFREQTASGVNAKIKIRLWRLDLELNHQYNFILGISDTLYPVHSGSFTISYHSMHFNNKLEVKVGLTSRYFSSFNAPVYDGFSNNFYWSYPFYQALPFYGNVIKLNSNATFDFFVVGKINKAIFGITFENLLNRAVVTTNYYPNQNRGGLFNVWSRFNITWYFLN